MSAQALHGTITTLIIYERIYHEKFTNYLREY
jgi:hypothetical protein